MRSLAAFCLLIAGCGPAGSDAPDGEAGGADEAVDALAETQLGLREAALAALVDVLERVPDSVPVPAANEHLMALDDEHMPALKGSWAAFQQELRERVSEEAYGARAQQYQALKGRFESELERLRGDDVLWKNLAPALVPFNSIFQP